MTANADWARGARWFVPALGVVAAALMLPALWNGYPFGYFDSGDYIAMPFAWTMPVYRTGAYGVFAAWGRLAGSLWGVIAAQSLINAYVLCEAARVLAPERPLRALASGFAAVLVLTGLPWATSQIMPDALTGAVVVATLALALGRGTLDRGALAPWRRGLLVLALAVATAVHTSHIAILGGLLVVLALARLLAARGAPLLRPRLGLAALGFALSLGLATGSNWLMTGRAFLTQSNAILTLGLFVETGLAKRYLDQVCVEETGWRPKLCQARDRLPDNANQFIWHDADFWAAGGWSGMDKEAHRIVLGALARFPAAYAWQSARLTARQLVALETGDGLQPMRFFLGKAIATYYPEEVARFERARQQDGSDFRPSIRMDVVNAVQVPAQLAGYAALVGVLFVAWRRRERMAATLAALVLLALLGNAFVCGALSNPNDRYQSRVAWLALWAVAFAVPRVARARPDARQDARQDARPETSAGA